MQSSSASRAPAKTATADEINNRLFFRLFQTGNIYQSQGVREVGVSAVQGAVLGELSRHQQTGMPFASLYAYLSVSRQNLDAVLKGLERLRYVERIEAVGDRRSKMVRLTPGGARAWNDILRRSFEFYRQATAGMSQAEIVACAEMLSRIGRGLKSVKLGDGESTGKANRRRRKR